MLLPRAYPKRIGHAGTVAFVPPLRSLAVFCGSSAGDSDRYVEVARECGATLGRRGIELVYGGGAVGLMGAVADACLEEGGRVVGVIPVGLFAREVGHQGVTVLHEVASMHERKQLMYELADAFLALPGGLGTLEEVAEVTTWAQLGLHAKPVALLDVDGFWSGLVAQLDHMVDTGFLKPANRTLVERCDTLAEALEHLATTEPVQAEKWITPDER
jgi:uncharacterized protein (TIGR00730 family)